MRARLATTTTTTTTTKKSQDEGRPIRIWRKEINSLSGRCKQAAQAGFISDSYVVDCVGLVPQGALGLAPLLLHEVLEGAGEGGAAFPLPGRGFEDDEGVGIEVDHVFGMEFVPVLVDDDGECAVGPVGRHEDVNASYRYDTFEHLPCSLPDWVEQQMRLVEDQTQTGR